MAKDMAYYSYEELSYERLCTLEKDDYLEKTLELYKDDAFMYEVFFNQESIGILILSYTERDIFIDYFEIFKYKRLHGLGRNFILKIIDEFKNDDEKFFKNICLNSLENSKQFWRSCGFMLHPEYDDMMYCKLQS